MAIYAAALHFARRSAPSTRSISSSYLLFRVNSTLFCNSYSHHASSFSTTSTNKSPSNTITTPDFFVDKYKFSPEIASKASSFSARIKKPQNPDLLLTFLRDKGFSHSHLQRIVRHHSQLLSACVETNVKPKFKIFEDLGLSSDEAAQVVAREFIILGRGANTTIHTLSVLKGLLGSNDHVIRLIKKHPSLFYADPEKTLLPNIEFLKSCGIQVQQINSLIYSCPSLFFISLENMRRCVCKADEMGVERSSRAFIYAVKTISHMSDETLVLKWKSFQDLGFSEDDILRAFRTVPLVIAVSMRKKKEVVEVLLESGKYDMSCIIKHPASLMHSIEKRFKPRLEVLKALEERSIINKWPTLSTLCTMSDESFFKKFVAPNINEVGKDFIAKTAFVEKLDTANGLKANLR